MSKTTTSPDVLIEASAGTGKTQALAERLIELVKGGVEPHEIVALTFSRAAAGEIFERFVSLLADRVAGRGESAALLRRVVSTQHLSQIGTLDSFLMRIVRFFPLELGLDGEVEIMDEYRAGQELGRISFGILRRTDRNTRRAFAEAFSLAMDGEDVRSFADSYRGFVETWHERVLAHPDPRAWGDCAAIWGGTPDWAETDEARLARLAGALEGLCDNAKWPEFAAWTRDFRGSFDGIKGFAKKFVEMGAEAFAHATVDVTFNRKAYSFGGAQAKAIRDALRGVYGYVVRRRLALARGVYTLISAYEAEYAAKVRGRGRLRFDDVPRLLASLGEDVRLALEYRLDARIRAWALDEFQDTSREQWKALGPLVEEAKQSAGEKSVFVVGDCKQAIYGWRHGDVGIFRRERGSGAYELRELNKTYRSSPAVVEAVTRIVVNGRLRAEFPGWEASEHVSAKPEMPGFVQAVDAPGRKLEDFFEPVRSALAAVDPVRRGISAAVLVRNNSTGRAVAEYLKLNGVEGVVWEGESAILDTPALQGFIDLVKLADHPGCGQALRHFRTTPLASALWPDGAPGASAVSQFASQAFTAKGLARAFRDIRALLPEDPSAAWSEFTEARFTDMLRAASEFELSMDPGTMLSDFADFLAGKKKRNLAEPGKVKIMTIHRSKGLGFDYVV
ncbi:MAG: UvrD-helicase domain-containing protein, partial [Kiritimatiellae bacterium]|nr:UvrD-helicase domain-containing protein [Kiritimatiellia bacterium]